MFLLPRNFKVTFFLLKEGGLSEPNELPLDSPLMDISIGASYWSYICYLQGRPEPLNDKRQAAGPEKQSCKNDKRYSDVLFLTLKPATSLARTKIFNATALVNVTTYQLYSFLWLI